jgi:hypothetical protein
MANPEHLEVVKKGAKAIAAWHRKHPSVRLDLERADLYHADLSGANLARAHLTGADLRHADLTCADLSEADLSETNLMAANLFLANLALTNLRGARLNSASLGYTIFADVDLSEVRGLDTVSYECPGTIGVETLFKSKGKIPECFLRGCGVPQALIDYLPALIASMEPIQFYSCFISHSSKDEEFCRRLYSRMRDEKLRVWCAPEHIKGGKKLFPQIDEAIRLYDKLLLVLSEASMNSDWVETEIRLARKREKQGRGRVLFPIRLVDFETIQAWQCFDADTGRDLAVEVREYFIPDFSNWKDHDQFEEAFARLMADLRAEAD